MSVLAMPPGLLRSTPIDPRTGLWTRPWLEYWEAQYVRLGGVSAPTNTDLDSMATEAAAQDSSAVQHGAVLGMLAQRVEALSREVAGVAALQARLGTLEQRCAILERLVAEMPSLSGLFGAVLARVEGVERLTFDTQATHAAVAVTQQRVEALERRLAYSV